MARKWTALAAVWLFLMKIPGSFSLAFLPCVRTPLNRVPTALHSKPRCVGWEIGVFVCVYVCGERACVCVCMCVCQREREIEIDRERQYMCVAFFTNLMFFTNLLQWCLAAT